MKFTLPYGESLRVLYAESQRIDELKTEAVHFPSWDLTPIQVLKVDLLLNGAFSPLKGFLGREDFESVCEGMRLADQTLWPVPITLDVSEEFADSLSEGQQVALRHPEGMILAILTVGEIWKPDLQEETYRIYGSKEVTDPEVVPLLRRVGPVYMGGGVEGLEPVPHHTFNQLRFTPAELRLGFHRLGWKRMVAYLTKSPIYRPQEEMLKRAAMEAKANLLIQLCADRALLGDGNYFPLVRCHQVMMKKLPEQTTKLNLLPLPYGMGGLREVLWHAMIQKNFGCTHLLVSEDYASKSKDDYHEMRSLAAEYEEELGIKLIAGEKMVYAEDLMHYVPRSLVFEDAKIRTLSEDELHRRLQKGLEIPSWFAHPEIIEELCHSYPPRFEQGFTVFFTGLSGAGKSTVAQVLMAKLMEIGTKPVTLLDGDIVRKNLSSELGFSKQHRDLNILRIGFVASEITKNRGVAICAPIAPYQSTRDEVRELISQYGGFIEVHVATPQQICENRDRKGLYAKARAGLIKGFTGVDDPYEAPEHPEVRLDTSRMSVEECVHEIFLYLEREGYLGLHKAS